MDWVGVRWDSISLRANSIGAYFAMLALDSPSKALLVSPILDMERLILDMMRWANVTERELSEKGEVATSFGQTLSWAIFAMCGSTLSMTGNAPSVFCMPDRIT